MGMLNKALENHQPQATNPIEPKEIDARYNPSSPENGLVLRVQGKVPGRRTMVVSTDITPVRNG